MENKKNSFIKALLFGGCVITLWVTFFNKPQASIIQDKKSPVSEYEKKEIELKNGTWPDPKDLPFPWASTMKRYEVINDLELQCTRKIEQYVNLDQPGFSEPIDEQTILKEGHQYLVSILVEYNEDNGRIIDQRFSCQIDPNTFKVLGIERT